jgi:nitrous oxidase accessory protein
MRMAFNNYNSGLKWPLKLLFSILIIFMISGLTSAATITVENGESIQAAIEKASPGDVIEVKSGTYKEGIEVTKTLTIIGIDSGEGMPVIESEGLIDSTVYLVADRCQLKGFKLLSPQGIGINVNSSFNSITNNAIEACMAGILLSKSNGNTVAYNDARISCQGLISLLRGDAIQLVNSNDNIIEGNNASGAYIGIYLSISHNNTVAKNNAHDNDYGLSFLDSSKNKVRENNPSNNSEIGIGNINCSDNIFTDNTAKDNVIGILFQDSNRNIIYLNDLRDNEQNAKSTGSQNRWYSPEPMSYSFGNKSITSYLGNYWSDYQGRDANGDGIGDQPYTFQDGNDAYPLMGIWERYAIDSSYILKKW